MKKNIPRPRFSSLPCEKYAAKAKNTVAVSTLPSTSTLPPSSHKYSSSIAGGKRVQGCDTLKGNLSRLTPEILITTLQKKPPAHVIRFMLSVNPKAASIPKTGPTPLQVAVKYNASVDVLEVLLEACPFALCVTNPNHVQDPLSYAKQHRKHEPDVLELLSRPLSFWVTEQKDRDPNASMTHYNQQDKNNCTLCTSQRQKHSSCVDRQELENVKLLCVRVLKSHKRLTEHITANQNQSSMDQTQQNSSNAQNSDLLKKLEIQQQKLFYRQLIALDMKERAMKAHFNKIENRCLKTVDIKFQGWKEGMHSWKSDTEAKLREWKVLLEHETKINAHFRNDLGQWMEEHVPTPILFATNLGETDEEIPLCPRDTNSQTSREVVVEGDLERVKKRPWKPFFRHWDKIMLRDDNEGQRG